MDYRYPNETTPKSLIFETYIFAFSGQKAYLVSRFCHFGLGCLRVFSTFDLSEYANPAPDAAISQGKGIRIEDQAVPIWNWWSIAAPSFVFILLISFLFLSACSYTVYPIPFTPTIETPEATFTPTSTLSIPTPTVNWIKTWTVRTDYASTSSLDKYTLVDLLFRKWIEQYEDENVGNNYKLEGYEIDDIIISKEYQQLSDPKGVDLIARVIYSVKPTLMNSTTWWVAGEWKTG